MKNPINDDDPRFKDVCEHIRLAIAILDRILETQVDKEDEEGPQDIEELTIQIERLRSILGPTIPDEKYEPV